MSDMAPSISSFCESADNSWVRCLTEDPESGANFPNRASREVRSGHFVKVPPTPLRDPFLVLHSEDLASELGLDAEGVSDPRFARFFSGDFDALPFPSGESWATPYALSASRGATTRGL